MCLYLRRRQRARRSRRSLTCGCCCHGSSWSARGARLAAGTQVRRVLPRSRTASRQTAPPQVSEGLLERADSNSRVAFDESGNTGPNLLDADQPVFVLCSVLGSAEVESVAKDEGELKFSKLRQSATGRRKILRVLNHDSLGPEKYVLSGMHKRFLAVTKVIDLLFEPLARLGGIDLYERGANLAMANLFYFTLPTFIGGARFDAFLASFVDMIRFPEDANVDAFYAQVNEAHSVSSEEGLKAELGALRVSREIVERDRGQYDGSSLDPAIPSFFQHASEWTGRLGVPFVVLHDASKPIEGEQVILEAMMSVSQPPELIGYDRRKMRFPLACTGIELVDSEAEPAVQVADIIASAASFVLRESLRGSLSGFSRDLLDSAVLEGTWAPVWPTPKFTPEELGTDEPGPTVDPHDLVGGYVSDRLGGIPPLGQRRKPRES